MAGKGIDRSKAQSALEVVRENPAISLVAAAPAIVIFGVAWWLLGFGWALILAILLGVAVVAGKKFLG
ncbi:fatty acid desaturase [Rhodococcus sp. PvR044]|jgi:hypothetical protein|uniref:hypothetical protein n=1 Tax=Rhodococcus TaxID=1827 RepID=UPI000979839C|nr:MULTISPECIES: hypothetical protein [Rhodococcus]AQA22214.1 putative membrane protein [Rhodococcus sp. MTM3W5.2]MBP1162614.1 fatty acid desaturase [Rhodococcus sp. PvR099]MCZ4555299.1 hypothetical protein [Rhodococcus maanshanensis]PTR43979.1 hypothetical protein C8K38_10558 [Rhodococcus sp. OK611]SNX90281.1 hypothetical protein SAMN05447004_10558 [Rhodococcus sp. OK270]